MIIIFLILTIYVCIKFKSEVMCKKSNLVVVGTLVVMSVSLALYRFYNPYMTTISAFLEKMMN